MTAQKIHEIIKDYQCDYVSRKFELTPEHIQLWADQFGDDSDFVLSELLHFLPEIYLSKTIARDLLRKRLLFFQNKYKYSTMTEFVQNTHFFNVQKPEKSQGEILDIIEDILQTEFMISFRDYLDSPKKNYIYFDDVLATGGTIFKNLSEWLSHKVNGVKNSVGVLNKSKTLDVSLFCCHQFGFGNLEWRLMKHSGDEIKKCITFVSDYKIENNLRPDWLAKRQRLNYACPIIEQPKNVMDYFNTIDATNSDLPVFRPKNLPLKETFFSSPENRIKLENLFIQKGIELLSKVKSDNPDKRKRPLGDSIRSHKTLGTGTLFFTWRNISNTCPLVFWWDVYGHEWIPLFCLKNRGV